MALRAVIFDYGMVLTGPPAPDAHDALVRLTGLPLDRFESHYWAHRHAYDDGSLTGLGFWQQFNRDAGLALTAAQLDELNAHDARMWTTQNPTMVAWQARLKQHGLRTAVLSNMGDTVFESVSRAFPWLANFDLLIWSYQVRLAKPDPAIYRLAIQRLALPAAEILFLDDKAENIQAALSVGLQALQFSTVDNLRTQLVEAGYNTDLPLPA